MPRKLPSLIGKKFGKLTVIEQLKEYKIENGRRVFPVSLCICECGVKKPVSSYSIVSGKTKSCGCINRLKSKEKLDRQTKKNLEKEKKSLVGKKFGKLTVIEQFNGYIKEDKKPKHGDCLCLCECGEKKRIRTSSLRYGKSKSCGCRGFKNTSVTSNV